MYARSTVTPVHAAKTMAVDKVHGSSGSHMEIYWGMSIFFNACSTRDRYIPCVITGNTYAIRSWYAMMSASSGCC